MAIKAEKPVNYDCWAIKSLNINAPKMTERVTLDVVFCLYRTLDNGDVEFHPNGERTLHIDDLYSLATTQPSL